MTTLTDKELIKEIKERIGSLDVRDNIERRAYEIALVSLEAEPVAWLHSDNGLGIPAITRSKNIADSWLSKGWYVQPLYIAKPVPVVPDVRPSLNNGIVGFDEGWNACRAAMLQAEPVSNSDELPLDYLQGHKDGLEWAAQLAEANHPQTGDWLYDDPIDLARAIRKGPDMPTVQAGNYPVTPDGWISCSDRMPEMGERQYYVLAADFKNNYPPSIPNTQVGVYGDWFNDGNPTWDDGDGEDLHLKEVTHWMPLPEPPQEVK
ncbi:TPA: DUF551 domain-containing protein [Escherichia coli]|uniref:DUF551 domain-containing protein n=1 Tax=Escherichia coli TaxID=562 RepID=UPI001C6F0059|nr:DUF551 domain-containing protein [Escherichia coli]MBW9032170.1 DUF551 domain-containing protein [Escherichia coli]HAW5650044.1 DUF551 domain-containing protein [Escherichia coli]